MRKILACSLLWLMAFTSSGQKYGNEWIDHSLQYFKFPIYKEGIYRIDSATLSTRFNLPAINPKNFQLFIRGKEQKIFVNGESDNQINTGDFIEFYASASIAEVDSLVYSNIKYLPNPYGPLFNDTIYGFLTVGKSFSTQRIILETDTNSILYPDGDHFYTEKVYTNPISYNKVVEFNSSVSDPRYTQAEGKGLFLYEGNSLATNFPDLLTYTNTPLPFFLTINYSGASKENTPDPDQHITLSYLDQNSSVIKLSDTLFNGFVAVRQTFSLNTQNILTQTNFTLRSIPIPSLTLLTNTTCLHYLKLFYPQRLNLNGQSVYNIQTKNSTTASKTTFKFWNFFLAGGTSMLLHDLSNGKKIPVVMNSGSLIAVVPNGAGPNNLYLTAEALVVNVNKLSPVNVSGNFTNYNANVSGKPYLIIYHSSLANSAMAYSDYRKSPAGGSYEVISADIKELYEQFSYGVNKHPVAISNFAKYLLQTLSVRPAHLLLLGKGVKLEDINSTKQYTNLLPTMGVPSSDNLLTTDVSVINDRQQIPTGRIAATTNKEVLDYLNKVQQHESSVPADWKKTVLHFVGGGTPDLVNRLAGFMQGYENTIKDTLFGAQVFTYKKTTTAPVQTYISDSLRSLINNGAALLNFFGHGSAQGFDQGIDDPNLYSNFGKYPFVIANSCYSGDVHIEGVKSVSERFVFAEQKGSIGFIATTSYGFDEALNDYTSAFYKALSTTHYNQPIGEIIKEATVKNAQSADFMTSLVGFDMTLHGDPAIVISNGLLPDYQIKNNDVSFDLKKHTDSLGINIHFKNLGIARRDSFLVRIERTFANGDSTVILRNIKAPNFKDSLKLVTFIDFTRGIGLNKFKVSLDYFNEIQETIETNNSTVGTVDIFIPGGDLLPVYPYKYAIIQKTNTVTLKASTTDPFAPLASYRFQLDTCDKFTAPISSTLITSTGGVLEWTVNLPYKDSTVYFWRVSRDSTSALLPFVWKESSFQTIGTKRGWGQSHFNQFKSDGYQFVKYTADQRKFVYQNDVHRVFARTGLAYHISGVAVAYYFDDILRGTWSCAADGWNFAVFDSISGLPIRARSLNFPTPGPNVDSACVCVPRELDFFSFGTLNNCLVKDWKKNMENFLNNIPKNNYVLAWTVGFASNNYAHISSYSNSLYNAFESIGANSIRTTSDSVPYILFGKKGMSAGQGQEVKGINKRSIIELTQDINTRWYSGYIVSEIIGPSYKWGSLHWETAALENTAGDTTILKLVGIRSNGHIDTLMTFTEDSTDVLNLAAYADANTHPYLKLVAFMKDNIHRTSPQLKRWQVLYDEAPECAINPLKGFASINDTLQEGDEVTYYFPIENIGVKDFKDSLVVTYWMEDDKRNKVPLPHRLKKPPFTAGQILIDTVKLNSNTLLGNNSLWIHVNPIQNQRYQKEQTQFNNIGRYGFKVSKDVTNPLLDVTFDGVRILNGDIVSAKPNILITLKDENKFLALNDTSAFNVFILSPGQSAQQRVYFAQGLEFTPASLPKNSATISYRPVFATDGRYTLIVQARDRSRNTSGANDYRIQFEVNNHPSVTQVLNYPNPFTTSTRFVFTLTGSEIPEVFTIQIMTVTGKLVRQITRSELGYIHIGRNITEYAWDGRDDFGDRLGNGVYLYRVTTKLNGESIDKNSSGADKFFVKDFGKMVLIR